MDGPRDCQTKSDKDKYRSILLIGTIEFFKMTQIDLFTKQKQTHRYIKQICGYQRGKGRDN